MKKPAARPAAHLPDGNAVKMRQVLQPYAPTPAVAPPSPFVWGMRDWLTTTLGRDFSLGFEEGIVLQRFASSAAAWDAYTAGFGPVRAVAESLDEARKNELRTVFETWVDQFRTGLGVSIPCPIPCDDWSPGLIQLLPPMSSRGRPRSSITRVRMAAIGAKLPPLITG